MGKSAPPPPDYTGAAQQQAASSQQATQAQTQANRPNQNTPWASSQWHQDPTTGQWTQTTGFTGQLGQAATDLQGQLAHNFASPLDNGTAARDQAIQSVYGQMTSRLNPQFALQGEQLDTKLANQGLSPGSAAYRQAESQFARNKNDAYQSAMNNAVQQGLQAQNLTFNQNMAARNMPLQELQGLGGFLAMPGFQGAGKADPTQYLAAALGLGNYNLQNAQMQNQSLGTMIGGGLGALGSALPFIL